MNGGLVTLTGRRVELNYKVQDIGYNWKEGVYGLV